MRDAGSVFAGTTKSLDQACLVETVMGEHFEEYFLFGLFFALLGWFQALWALAVVVSPTRWVLVSGLVVNAQCAASATDRGSVRPSNAAR